MYTSKKKEKNQNYKVIKYSTKRLLWFIIYSNIQFLFKTTELVWEGIWMIPPHLFYQVYPFSSGVRWMHSTKMWRTVRLHWQCSHWGGRKKGNVLFNDALNTFYLRLFGVRHMVKDHSDSEKGNPLQPHRLLFPINSKGSFISTEMEDLSSRYMNGSDRHERCGHGTVSESRKYNYWQHFQPIQHQR